MKCKNKHKVTACCPKYWKKHVQQIRKRAFEEAMQIIEKTFLDADGVNGVNASYTLNREQLQAKIDEVK